MSGVRSGGDGGDNADESPLVVVMGVSGSGKTTVGELLAERLDVEFADADQFHSKANIAKMAAGVPLTDDDRWPWLEAIGEWMAEHQDTGAVATCSALRRAYRDVLRRHAPGLWFLDLTGTAKVMAERIEHRGHHFMPVSLVGSQFDTLEPPDDDEQAVMIDVTQSPAEIVEEFIAALAERGAVPES